MTADVRRLLLSGGASPGAPICLAIERLLARGLFVRAAGGDSRPFSFETRTIE